MTNEQLKIMLMGLYSELGAALEESRAELQRTIDRPPGPLYIEKKTIWCSLSIFKTRY